MPCLVEYLSPMIATAPVFSIHYLSTCARLEASELFIEVMTVRREWRRCGQPCGRPVSDAPENRMSRPNCLPGTPTKHIHKIGIRPKLRATRRPRSIGSCHASTALAATSSYFLRMRRPPARSRGTMTKPQFCKQRPSSMLMDSAEIAKVPGSVANAAFRPDHRLDQRALY